MRPKKGEFFQFKPRPKTHTAIFASQQGHSKPAEGQCSAICASASRIVTQRCAAGGTMLAPPSKCVATLHAKQKSDVAQWGVLAFWRERA